MSPRSLEQAAQQAARRLRVFQRIAANASELGTRVDLAPSELWESEDQSALDALEMELRIAGGERPLIEVEP